MSADNGIYILHSKDGFRVAHLQCIENLWWKNGKHQDAICPDRLIEMFGECEVFATRGEALAEAHIIYEEIINDDMGVGIIEYGIQNIEYDKEFPNDKKKYKSFREQFIECGKNGNRIKVPCVKCEQANLICIKYKTYCHSKACLKERTT